MIFARLNYHVTQVIMIARLHAMYQQSRKMLVFLAVSFLALTIISGVFTVIDSRQDISGGGL